MRQEYVDILIVGAGGAGLRAAVAAKHRSPELKVAVLAKGKVGKCGVTASAYSDRMAFHATLPHTEPKNSDIPAWHYHSEDIYRLGGKVSDKSLADILAQNSREAYEYLDALGVPFVKKNGLADQFLTDGSLYARACYVGPDTAIEIEKALYAEASKLDICFYERYMVVSLLKKGGKISGALAIDRKNQSYVFFNTPCIILAAGGAGGLYANNVYPGGMTGDALALAYQAGAAVTNVEFVQFVVSSKNYKICYSGAFMRAIPRFINDKGEEIIFKYLPYEMDADELYNILFAKGSSCPVTAENLTHIFDVAVYSECLKGNKVYLDYETNPRGFSFDLLSDENKEKYRKEMRVDNGEQARYASPLGRLKEINPRVIEWFRERGFDLEKEKKLEAVSSAQHFQGGVKIDSKGRTQVEGLWAAGEAAGGHHGANRPGGNALLDCIVFGKISGENAAEYAEKASRAQVSEDEINSLLPSSGQASAEEVRRTVRRIMDETANVIRTEKALKNAIAQIEALISKGIDNSDCTLEVAAEARNMLAASRLILTACLTRDESRGPHLRFSEEDRIHIIPSGGEKWEKYILLSRQDENGIRIQIENTT